MIIIALIGLKYIASIIIAASLAVVAMPLYQKMKRKLPAPLSAACVSVLISALIVGIGVFIITVVILGKDCLADMLQEILIFIGEVFGVEVERGTGTDIIHSLLDLFSGYVPDIALTAVSATVYLTIASIMFFAALYLFFIFGERLCADLWSIIPDKSRPNMALMGKKTRDILFALYIVQVVVAFLTFLLAIPYLVLMGYGNIILFATLCGFFALIPILGAPMVLIFLGLYALAIGDIYGVIVTITVGIILLWLLPDFYLRPKFTGKRVQIRPMLIFVGFFGGAAIMGIIGFVLGPVLLVLGMAAYEIFFKEMKEIKCDIDGVPADALPPGDEEKK